MTPPAFRRFLFVVASSRRHGNTEQLARHAARALPPTTAQEWIDLTDAGLPAFVDRRHDLASTPWQPTVDGAARPLLEATLAATDIVILSPVYWYAFSAPAKLYLDHWTAWLRAPGWDFKTRMQGKTLWGVSVGSDTDPRYFEPIRLSLQWSADYLGMRWGGLLAGYGNRPGDVRQDAASIAAAENFFVDGA